MFLLHALQSPINIGMILRTAEVFETGVMIYDAHGVMKGDAIETIADFACGALGRRPPLVFDRAEDCVARVKGRLIATGLDENAKPLPYHKWQSDDCVVLGNEYDGLPDPLVARADSVIWVPTSSQYLPKPISASPIDPHRVERVRNNGDTSLNVAATAAIIAYSRYQAMQPAIAPGRKG